MGFIVNWIIGSTSSLTHPLKQVRLQVENSIFYCP
jgi:hypothetical protein